MKTCKHIEDDKECGKSVCEWSYDYCWDHIDLYHDGPIIGGGYSGQITGYECKGGCVDPGVAYTIDTGECELLYPLVVLPTIEFSKWCSFDPTVVDAEIRNSSWPKDDEELLINKPQDQSSNP